MDKKIRTYIGIGLAIMLIVMISLVVINRDKLFTQRTTVSVNGCTEVYINGILDGEECPALDSAPYQPSNMEALNLIEA